jgi:hypothetical protein
MPAFHAPEADDALFLPVVWDRIVFHAPVESRLWCHARIRPEPSSDRSIRTLDFAICAEDGRLLLTIEGLHFKRVERGVFFKSASPRVPEDRLYRIEWETVPGSRLKPAPVQLPACR